MQLIDGKKTILGQDSKDFIGLRAFVRVRSASASLRLRQEACQTEFTSSAWFPRVLESNIGESYCLDGVLMTSFRFKTSRRGPALPVLSGITCRVTRYGNQLKEIS